MRTIIAYKMVEDCYGEEVVKEVNNLIKLGWQPYGSIAKSGIGGLYSQPMVKYESALKADTGPR